MVAPFPILANGSMLQTSQLGNEQTKPMFGMESEILRTHPSGKRLLQLAYEALPTRRLALQIRTIYQKVFNLNQKSLNIYAYKTSGFLQASTFLDRFNSLKVLLVSQNPHQ